jgi:hypothetical protein
MECEDSSLGMRRLLVLLSLAALATGAAESASGAVPVTLRTPGTEFVELLNGNGRAALTRRGALFVSLGRGRIRVVDLAGGGRPNLNPPCQRRARRVNARTIEIRGRNIGCRIWSGDDGGPWQVIIRGRRISASGSVLGSLTLDAVDSGATGVYRIAGGAWRAWPRTAHTYVLHRN